MKIAVIGIGYVGLSNAIVLAQKNEVVLVDIVEEKINLSVSVIFFHLIKKIKQDNFHIGENVL